MSNKGPEEESKISEEVVTDNDMLLVAKNFGDFSKLLLSLVPLLFRVLSAFAAEPIRIDVR